MILMGKIVRNRGAQLGHEHRETAVADDGNHLTARIGELTGDSEDSRPVAIEASMPVPVRRLTFTKLDHSCGKMGVGAAIQRQNGVIREEIAEHAHHHLGAQRRLGKPMPLDPAGRFQSATLLRFVEERAIGLSLDQRQQPLQGAFDVAGQPDLYGITQAEPVRLEVDLNAACLTWRRIIFFPVHGRAENEHCIACLHCPRRRRGSEIADAAGRQRRVVRQHGLAEQRFCDGSIEQHPPIWSLPRGAPSAPCPARMATR